MLKIIEKASGHLKDRAATYDKPVAYAVFASNGNIRMWCADPIQTETLRQEYGEALQPLYTAPQPAPDVAKLVEALESAYHLIANHSGETLPTRYVSDQMDMIDAALAAYRKTEVMYEL